MIERNVRLPSGEVADRHRAWYLCHDADSEVTTVHVLHYAGDVPVTSIGYEFDLDVGLTFDEAEALVAELPEMEEYVDARAELVADMAAHRRAGGILRRADPGGRARPEGRRDPHPRRRPAARPPGQGPRDHVRRQDAGHH